MLILKDEFHKARKAYHCDASINLIESGILDIPEEFKVTHEDKKILDKIKQENFMILPGTTYRYQVAIDGSDFVCVKCRPDVIEICEKYDLFMDE